MRRTTGGLLITASVTAGATLIWYTAPLRAEGEGAKSFTLKEAHDYDFQATKSTAKFLGLEGCASASCHGGGTSPQDATKVMNQRATYEKDPHHEAHLGSKKLRDKAKEIAEKLGLKERPHKSARCLACHATGGRNFAEDDLPKERQGEKYSVRDGVSCEACHGAGEKFVDVHNKANGYAQAVALGMTPTLDPVIRGNLCLSCHGKIDAELVTKGGHPKAEAIVLNVYRREHQHWPNKTAGAEAKTWAIGQVVGLYGNLATADKPDGADTGRAQELVKAHQAALGVFAKALPSLAGPGNATSADADAQYAKLKDATISDTDARKLAKALLDAA
ncbi:MAG TPA: multiheme c-type cytochrome, partial [Phycisphaerae bacterium]